MTVLAFVNAYRALRKGDSRQANKMFRARIAAQGFTVVAMVAGSMYYSKDREKTKELRKLKEERDAEEKRQKWIRELEARDEEEKAIRAMIKKKQSGSAGQGQGQPDPAADGEQTQGTGGILGKMGLWSKGEEAAAEAARAKAAAEPALEKKSRKENPKSSLGALSEIYGKKDDESKK